MTETINPTKKSLGCNKNLDRALCGEISFANKIILCDDCVFKLIEERYNFKEKIQNTKKRIKALGSIREDKYLEAIDKIFLEEFEENLI